jgi:two-component system, OmpR family, response regulator RstA
MTMTWDAPSITLTPEAVAIDLAQATPASQIIRPGMLIGFVGPLLQPGSELRRTLTDVAMRCFWLPTRAEALQAATQAAFDAVLVDSQTLGRDPTALLELRATFSCPLLVLASGESSDVDEIIALELGADAYVAAPLSPRLLRARLLALTRRRRRLLAWPHHEPPATERRCPQFGGWLLDPIFNTLTRDDTLVNLTDVQCALLDSLIDARGSIVSRQGLAHALRHGPEIDKRTVDVYIHRLRKRLRESGALDLAIKAERARGYRLVWTAPPRPQDPLSTPPTTPAGQSLQTETLHAP